jgi:DamX protein
VVVKAVDNAWYREQPKNRAVLQLGAFNDEKAALDFIKKHSASTRLGAWHVFSQKRNNQLLYTATLGNFLTLADARKAALELAEPLRAFKPYPRTFEAIGKVISP